jgi:hypothetical protein
VQVHQFRAGVEADGEHARFASGIFADRDAALEWVATQGLTGTLKISGCHRSTTGAEAWLRARGYISTARKHGINVMTAIRDAVTGQP